MTIPIKVIPNFFESGYRDGVWVTDDDYFLQNPEGEFNFQDGERFFLYFTSYHLGPEPIGDRKNLIGVEIIYGTYNDLPDVWALKINKYVNLGTVRGNKEVKKMQRLGELGHLVSIYGVDNIKYIRSVANFDELTKDILKYVGNKFKPPNFDPEDSDVIRYYRPLEIPDDEKIWYSDRRWLDKFDFETNLAINLDLIPDNERDEGSIILFTSSNFMLGNEAELGLFMIVYDEISLHPQYTIGQEDVLDYDIFPREDSFRFLGFVGTTYQLPKLEVLEDLVKTNNGVFEEYYNTIMDFYYCGKINSFKELRPGIRESFLGWDNLETVRKMKVFANYSMQ